MATDRLLIGSLLIAALSFFIQSASAQDNCFGEFCEETKFKTKNRQTQVNVGTIPNNTNNTSNNTDLSAGAIGGGNPTPGATAGSTVNPNQIGVFSEAAASNGSAGSNGIGSGCGSRACLSRGSGQCGQGETPDRIRELLDQDPAGAR